MEKKNDKQWPKIGLNRKFFKEIFLNPFESCEDEIFPEKKNPEIENLILEETSQKQIIPEEPPIILKYKSNRCKVVYDQEKVIPKDTIIDYQKLLELISLDGSSIETFISSEKGEWKNNDEENFEELIFESRFESGNLRMVIQTDENEYDLLLKNDINASKYSQWFYFQLKTKLSCSKKLTFNIINCEKEHLIFNNLKILCYSENLHKWRRVGEEISYYVNKHSKENKKLYTLSFSFFFNHENINDTLYFSYCFPYTYTDLQNYIENLLMRTNSKTFLRHEILTKSLAGNKIDLIVITNLSSSFEEIALRPAIILTGRVHPGESNSSFVIQGVLDYLISETRESYFLRNQYIFKIIPMLNPDGVINGNYRTSLSGKDLNRLWPDPRENVCPEILAVKNLVKTTLLSRNVYMYCDFHGHSNKYNNFMYGCPQGNLSKNEKVFPTIFADKCDNFDPTSTIYKICKKKLKTARAIMKKEFEIDYSYCSESSILGVSMGSKKNYYYTQKMYLEIGEIFSTCLYDFSFPDIFTSYMSKIKIDSNGILNNNVLINNNNLIEGLNNLEITKKKKSKKTIMKNKTTFDNSIKTSEDSKKIQNFEKNKIIIMNYPNKNNDTKKREK